MKVFGQLEKAQFENLASNPTAGVAGRVIYNSTAKKPYYDDGTVFRDMGGGGGSNLIWRNDSEYEAVVSTRYGQLCYEFTVGETQKILSAFKVPNGYAAGAQIKLKVKIFSPTGSNTLLITSKTTLIRVGTDALSSTTNQRTSTNTAQAIDTANKEYLIDLDLTDASGQINSVAVSANDTILIELYRGTDANTDILCLIPSTTEVTI